MADAWTNLLEHSAAASGCDAWEHLLAQEGGGSIDCPDRYVASNGLSFSIVPRSLSFSVIPSILRFKLDLNTVSFVATEPSFTMKLGSVDYTFHFKRVIS